MDEVLKPDEEMLSTLATEMGLRATADAAPKSKDRPKDVSSAQKSYAQLT